MADEHRSQLACMPVSGVTLHCYRNLEDIPHWTALMGIAPSLGQVNSAWEYHLNEEQADRDG
jgi:hypothetical protein